MYWFCGSVLWSTVYIPYNLTTKLRKQCVHTSIIYQQQNYLALTSSIMYLQEGYGIAFRNALSYRDTVKHVHVNDCANKAA